MFQLFRWRRKYKNDNKTTPDRLIKQEYKKYHSHVTHERQSLGIYKYQVIINRQKIFCHFIMREKIFDSYYSVKFQITY